MIVVDQAWRHSMKGIYVCFARIRIWSRASQSIEVNFWYRGSNGVVINSFGMSCLKNARKREQSFSKSRRVHFLYVNYCKRPHNWLSPQCSLDSRKLLVTTLLSELKVSTLFEQFFFKTFSCKKLLK